MKYVEINLDGNKEKQKKLTKDSLLYLKTKEKTISDSIKFYSSNTKAIDSILSSFNNVYFNQLLDNKDQLSGDSAISIEIEKEIMNRNLRSIIFTCQKTADMLNRIDFDLNQSFLKSILLGNIAFSLKKKNDDSVEWTEKGNTSSKLGTYKYPLYKFSYNYISNQYFDLNALKNANIEYLKREEFEKNQTEITKYLNIIYSYYVATEQNVLEAQKYIIDKLETTNIIPFNEYLKLANYFIAIKGILKCNQLTEQLKKAIMNNLEKSNLDNLNSLEFYDGIVLESEDLCKEFKEFKNQMFSKIRSDNNVFISFDYSIENLDTFCEKICRQKDKFVEKRSFAKNINNDRLIELLKMCTARQMYSIIEIYLRVYSFSNINEFFQDDKESIKDLRIKVNELSNENRKYDRIQVMQLKFFVNNLQDIENRL